jgi:hypothetical protein
MSRLHRILSVLPMCSQIKDTITKGATSFSLTSAPTYNTTRRHVMLYNVTDLYDNILYVTWRTFVIQGVHFDNLTQKYGKVSGLNIYIYITYSLH